MKIEFSDEEVKEIVRKYIQGRYFSDRNVPIWKNRQITIEGSVWSIRANVIEPELSKEIQF